MNARSASIEGIVGEGNRVELTVGQAGSTDLSFDGGSLLEGMSCEEELEMICRTVFTTRFCESVTYNQRGRIVSSELVLSVGDKRVGLGSTTLLGGLVGETTTKQFRYEPYY